MFLKVLVIRFAYKGTVSKQCRNTEAQFDSLFRCTHYTIITNIKSYAKDHYA